MYCLSVLLITAFIVASLKQSSGQGSAHDKFDYWQRRVIYPPEYEIRRPPVETGVDVPTIRKRFEWKDEPAPILRTYPRRSQRRLGDGPEPIPTAQARPRRIRKRVEYRQEASPRLPSSMETQAVAEEAPAFAAEAPAFAAEAPGFAEEEVPALVETSTPSGRNYRNYLWGGAGLAALTAAGLGLAQATGAIDVPELITSAGDRLSCAWDSLTGWMCSEPADALVGATGTGLQTADQGASAIGSFVESGSGALGDTVGSLVEGGSDALSDTVGSLVETGSGALGDTVGSLVETGSSALGDTTNALVEETMGKLDLPMFNEPQYWKMLAKAKELEEWSQNNAELQSKAAEGWRAWETASGVVSPSLTDLGGQSTELGQAIDLGGSGGSWDSDSWSPWSLWSSASSKAKDTADWLGGYLPFGSSSASVEDMDWRFPLPPQYDWGNSTPIQDIGRGFPLQHQSFYT